MKEEVTGLAMHEVDKSDVEECWPDGWWAAGVGG